jgi:uncharacterized protein YbbK (DUF523 family)/uncharacterized protein YbgA (DUF1722 family)
MDDRAQWMEPDGPIRIGVSSCLLGEPVRWDGSHRHDPCLTGTLGALFTFVPLCPEVAVGLGVPRQPIRLVWDAQAPRAVGVRDPSLDATRALREFGRRTAEGLSGLSGWILKSGSPSCGMARVRVYRPGGGAPSRRGVGLFAAALLAARPGLPVEEEGRLADPALRENFIERVFAYRRWQALLAAGQTPARLAAFHEAHKLALLAHGAGPARALGRILADAGPGTPAALRDAYGPALMAVLRRKATRRGHAHVLHHLTGCLGGALDGAERAGLLEAIDAYRRGLLPRVVPVTLLRRHFRRHPHPLVAGQTYLAPHPGEPMPGDSL